MVQLLGAVQRTPTVVLPQARAPGCRKASGAGQAARAVRGSTAPTFTDTSPGSPAVWVSRNCSATLRSAFTFWRAAVAAGAAGAPVCARQGRASSVAARGVNRVRIMEKDTDAVFDPAIL